MRPLKPLLHTFASASDIVRSILFDTIDSGSLDDSSSLWTTKYLRDTYNRFINTAYTRNPHLKGLGVDLSSDFNEALIHFMVAEAFSVYKDDKYNLKRYENAVLLYNEEMNKISIR